MKWHIDQSKLFTHNKLVRKIHRSYFGVVAEQYLFNWVIHNPYGPAYISYYKNGTVARKDYCLYGRFHNSDGPAYISYYKNGTDARHEYYYNGVRHRADGPAVINYKPDGKISEVNYWIDGMTYSPEEFYGMISK